MRHRSDVFDRLFPGLLVDPGYEVALLRVRATCELPRGQARVVRALLVDGPEFEPPERPVTYEIAAIALGIAVSTLREHLRRVAQRHPDLHAGFMAERERRLTRWHRAVAEARRERSRRRGKRRWAREYLTRHGSWPWEALAAGIT